MTHVAALLRTAPALNVDETPARAAKSLAYVHVACTRYLTHLHVAGRSAADIDAGGVLPGYAGVLMRDGYAGYSHLTGAVHAWCGAHYPDLGIMPTWGWRPLLVGVTGLVRSA
jgi:transposase